MNLLIKNFKVLKWQVSLVAIIWFLLAAIGTLLKIRLGIDKIGNYLIFENTFYRTIYQTNLYWIDPSANLGSYLYGPLFSILIAPFAVCPVKTGAFLWGMANAAILFLAIKKLPVADYDKNFIVLFSAIEMVTSVQNMQINCIIASLIILSFIFVEKEKDFWATFFIVAGFLIKIYGIAGIVFFLFSKRKIRFIWSFIFWMVALFCLPMLISSPSFVVHSYSDWYYTLIAKDISNTYSEMQNISVMGMLRHFVSTKHLNELIILPAAVLYAIPLLRRKQFKELSFRLSYLAFALIGIVIFSSSAESPTYIIAVTGVAIWYTTQRKKNVAVLSLLILTFLITSLSATDLFPSFIRTNFIRPYALKALPCFLVWIVISFQLMFKNFKIPGKPAEVFQSY